MTKGLVTKDVIDRQKLHGPLTKGQQASSKDNQRDAFAAVWMTRITDSIKINNNQPVIWKKTLIHRTRMSHGYAKKVE